MFSRGAPVCLIGEQARYWFSTKITAWWISFPCFPCFSKPISSPRKSPSLGWDLSVLPWRLSWLTPVSRSSVSKRSNPWLICLIIVILTFMRQAWQTSCALTLERICSCRIKSQIRIAMSTLFQSEPRLTRIINRSWDLLKKPAALLAGCLRKVTLSCFAPLFRLARPAMSACLSLRRIPGSKQGGISPLYSHPKEQWQAKLLKNYALFPRSLVPWIARELNLQLPFTGRSHQP